MTCSDCQLFTASPTPNGLCLTARAPLSLSTAAVQEGGGGGAGPTHLPEGLEQLLQPGQLVLQESSVTTKPPPAQRGPEPTAGSLS